MPADYFLDTNVLVYTFHPEERVKHKTATVLVEQALDRGLGIISWQVVQEFLNVATRKFKTPLQAADARAYLDTVLLPLCTVYPSEELYRLALEIMAATGYGFYDSLILAAASSAGCPVLYSEDLQAGRTVRGVTITNPFA